MTLADKLPIIPQSAGKTEVNIVMEYNVAQLMKGPVGAVRRYDVDEWLPTIEQYASTEPVRGHVKLTRTNRGVLVELQATTALQLQCSRCLEDLVCPLEIGIREEFLPTVDVVTGLPVDIPSSESNAFTIDEHHILDLSESVRQYALLEVPLQPLCRADCAGLCPTCGADRNAGQCACLAEPEDARLAVLARLLGPIEDKE